MFVMKFNVPIFFNFTSETEDAEVKKENVIEEAKKKAEQPETPKVTVNLKEDTKSTGAQADKKTEVKEAEIKKEAPEAKVKTIILV